MTAVHSLIKQVRNLLVLSLSVFVVTTLGQTVDEVTTSGHYIYAFGQGKNYKEADRDALNQLATQVTVHIRTIFTSRIIEQGDSISRNLDDFVQTYSGASFENAISRQVSDSDGEVRVIRFISLGDLNDLFLRRIHRVREYYNGGVTAERDLRIADALRNYYWAYVLLQSIPARDTVTGIEVPGKRRLLISLLPEKLNETLSCLELRVTRIDTSGGDRSKAVYLEISWRGKPVSNFDFSFWNGNSYSPLQGTADGLAVIELTGPVETRLEILRIYAEYRFEQKNWDRDVTTLLQLPEQVQFGRSVFAVKPVVADRGTELPVAARIEEAVERSTSAGAEFLPGGSGHADTSVCLEVVSRVLMSVRQGGGDDLAGLFTPEGYRMFTGLMMNGRVRLLTGGDELRPVIYGKRVDIRSVPVKFAYKGNKREFVENLVFCFNEQGLIDGISYALGNRTMEKIVSLQNKFWDNEEKYRLIRFLEAYKTAYALKRLDFISSVFADNALIIVGNVLQQGGPIDGMYNSLGNNRIRYVRLNKSDYMERLRGVFNTNEFVNIQFEETSVVKRNDSDKLYGIQLEQHYFSSRYSDKGYLFLMIDLNDPEAPKIFVRTWQPERNEDGSVIGLENFRF